MNKTKCKKALFDLADVLEKNDIKYHLMHGTLLGAIREKNFIEGDIDIDLGIFKKFWLDNNLFQRVARDLLQKNIHIKSVWLHSAMSLGKGEIPLDLYWMEKFGKVYRHDASNSKLTFPEKFLNTLDTIEFLGRKFPVPHNPEEFLAYRYGNDWKIRKLRNKSYKDTTIRTWRIFKKTLKIPMYFNIFEESIKGKK